MDGLIRILQKTVSTTRTANLLMFSRYKRQRTLFVPNPKTFKDRNHEILNQYQEQKLKLTQPVKDQPDQWNFIYKEKVKKYVEKERKLLKLHQEMPPFHPRAQEDIDRIEDFNTYYDPYFNPRLYEERNRVDPHEEPFNAIYADSTVESASQYTKCRNITTPELWSYVEKLGRIKVPPRPKMRKPGEPVKAMPSGFVPPPELIPSDYPYAISRTRNYLLPVYYYLDQDPEKCVTCVKLVTGDLWQLEKDLREHLDRVEQSSKRTLTSVYETDGRVLFRGKHLKEIVAWLHEKGF